MSALFCHCAAVKKVELDSSFGASGKFAVDFDSGSDGANHVILSGENIFGVGQTQKNGQMDFAITKLSSAGILDSTFDTDGKLTFDFSSGSDVAYASLVLDEKLWVAGTSEASGLFRAVIAVVKSDGSLDTSFNTTGKLSHLSGASTTARAVANQEGKVLVGGSALVDSKKQFYLFRLKSNGSLDTDFGTSGVVRTSLSSSDEVRKIIVMSNGKILNLGSTVSTTDKKDNQDFAILRYSSNGTLDATFGTAGSRIVDFSSGKTLSQDNPTGLIIDGNGRILVSGSSFDGTTYRMVVARFDESGTLDSSFGVGGKAVITYSVSGTDYHIQPMDLCLTGEGRVYLVGYTTQGTAVDSVLCRLGRDGILDTTVGTSGFLTIDFDGHQDKAHSVAVQPDGKLLISGQNDNASNFDFSFIRIQQ